MKNKNKPISLRLNEKEYNILSTNSNYLHMTNSEYIRSLITNAVPVTENHNQEIASIMCKIQIRLAELGLESEEITKEIMTTSKSERISMRYMSRCMECP